MVQTVKFSQFVQGGPQNSQSRPVGLQGGFNTIWTGGGGGGGGSGAVVQIITQSNTFGPGDVGKALMVNLSGQYVFALADNAADAEAVGLLLTVIDNMHFAVQEIGYATFPNTSSLTSLSPGVVYWLTDNPATPGVITSTQPTTIGHVSKPMFIADTAQTGWILAMRGFVIGSGLPGGGGGGGGGGTNPVIVQINQVNTFVGGEIVRLNNAGLYVEAQADTEADAEVIGFVLNIPAPTGTTFSLQSAGFNAGPGPLGGVSPYGLGVVYFLSPTTPGTMVTPEPSAAGQWSKPVFIAASTTTGWILEQRAIIATSAGPLSVPGGGTGATSFVPFGPIIGGPTPTSPLESVTPGPAGTVLTSNGPTAAPTYQPVPGVTFPITVPQGGTGVVTLPAFEIIAGGTTNTNPVQSITNGILGLPLLSQGAGALPAFGVLGTGGGGTGNSTYTPNEVIVSGPTSSSPLTTLSSGTAGFVLTSNGVALPTFQPVPGAGPGAVLQIQFTSSNTSTQFSTASLAWQETGLSLTITPFSVRSVIMLQAMLHFVSDFLVASNNVGYVAARFLRNGSTIPAATGPNNSILNSPGTSVVGPAEPRTNPYAGIAYFSSNTIFVDSPATTSAITYDLQVSIASGSMFSAIYLNGDNFALQTQNTATAVSTFIATEFAS